MWFQVRNWYVYGLYYNSENALLRRETRDTPVYPAQLLHVHITDIEPRPFMRANRAQGRLRNPPPRPARICKAMSGHIGPISSVGENSPLIRAIPRRFLHRHSAKFRAPFTTAQPIPI